MFNSDVVIKYVLFTRDSELDAEQLIKSSSRSLAICQTPDEAAASGGVLCRVDPVSDRPLPPAESLPYFSRGFNEQVAAEFMKCTTAISILGLGPFDPEHRLLKDLTICIAAIAAKTNAFIFDEADSMTFTLPAFDAIRAEPIREGVLSNTQFGIRAYRVDEHLRSVTMGLEKFGQKNFCVPAFPEHFMSAFDSLNSLIVQHIIESPTIVEPGAFELDLKKLNSKAAAVLAESITEGGTGAATVELGPIEPQGGDPEELLGPKFKAAPGDTLWEEQQGLLEQVLGKARSLSQDVSMESIEEEIERAREEALSILRDPAQWQVPGRRMKVAIQFPQTQEICWAEIEEWNGDEGGGILLSAPSIEGLTSGSRIGFPGLAIMDYTLSNAEQTIASGGIDELVRQMQS